MIGYDTSWDDLKINILQYQNIIILITKYTTKAEIVFENCY